MGVKIKDQRKDLQPNLCSVHQLQNRNQVNHSHRNKSLLILVLSVILLSQFTVCSQQITYNQEVAPKNTNNAPLRKLDDDEDDVDDEDDQAAILQGAADFEEKNVAAGGESSTNGEEGELAELEAIRQQSSTVQSSVPHETQNTWESQDLKERYEKGEMKITMDSIFPRGGPLYGTTRVTIRARGLSQLIDAYPNPKCKFGTNDMIVDATYIKCSKAPLTFYQLESVTRNETCVQCEASPEKEVDEIIDLQMSLTGKFDDVFSSLPYRYYKPLFIGGIYPRYGPKDGDTVVQVWGDNFLDLGDDFRCNFGSDSTKAHYQSSGPIWCRAAYSDVVQRPMPFSVSLNRQQNSLQPFSYWYYNKPKITKITPDYGPMSGNTKVILKGMNFMPFDWKLDIDNQNDTFCNWGELGKTHAAVISSTEAECVSPANTMHLEYASLNLTLNNQNYTQDDIRFLYYNPPKILNAEPLLGPVRGGTEVNLWGAQFEKNRNITCVFGGIESKAYWKTEQHLQCPAPEVEEPQTVELVVQYENDRFKSEILNYTYFANPELFPDPLSPSCGPVSGYTRIKVRGKNFIEFGFGSAKCIFNNSIYMNATVVDDGTIICDSPQLDGNSEDMWYNVSVTLDGDFKTNQTGVFKYYRNPTMESVSPDLGPVTGATNSFITGKGFNETNICHLTVRYGHTHVAPTLMSDTELDLNSPPVTVPGEVVVSVSGNGQQFINDKTLHYRDKSNSFYYYEDFFVQSVTPTKITNSGNSPVILRGMQFDQFKYDNGTFNDRPIQCRFKRVSDGIILDEPKNMTRLTDSKMECVAPKADTSGHTPVRIEMSPNGQNWQDTGHDLAYFNGPRVTQVEPPYGVTKNKENLDLTVMGENFECPPSEINPEEEDCSKIRVRFTNKFGDEIFMDGHKTTAGAIKCPIPKYPSPETLDVDITMNDQDYTNNGIQFGYIDPYILGVSPRLVSSKGTTKLRLDGYGFVQMEEDKTLVDYMNNKEGLQCSGGPCTKNYHVENENVARVDTFVQDNVLKSSGTNVQYEPFTVNMMDPAGNFAANDIDLWYYRDPVFNSMSSTFAYANEHKPIMVNTNFFWGEGNQLERVRKHGNFTCRFIGDSGKQMFEAGVMETNPIGAYKQDQLPDQIRCRTPKWEQVENAVMEISINGQDYIGGTPPMEIQFVDRLTIQKIAPLSGPLGGDTEVTLYGTGFNSATQSDRPVYVKFGTAESQVIDKAEISDHYWNDEEYYNKLHFPKTMLRDTEVNDVTMVDGNTVKKYVSAVSPDITRLYQYTTPDVAGLGGPVYIQVGEQVPINVTEHDPSVGGYGAPAQKHIDVAYHESSYLEFYFYRQPTVQKIEPSSGLTAGGTQLELTGYWFDNKPEYGVYPFCQIGSHIIKGQFISSTKIICKTPPSTETNIPSAVAVSLNGVDFQDTGFFFNYYDSPVIVDVQPRSGSIEGGTELWLKGLKFTNITGSLKTVKCRFRQIPGVNTTFDVDSPPTRYIPAYFVDNDTMKCASPTGWVGGDQVKVDLTFNGVDYTEASFPFSFYNIYGSFPKSGPADAYDDVIRIRGKGFRKDESTILCVLNGTEVAPITVRGSQIKCPMVLENWPSDRYESVNFHVKIDGSTHDFGNFHYYEQPTLEDVAPLVGPQEGRGAIYFIGRNFRNDFENSNLGCRIGNTLGSASLIDSETIRCEVTKKVPLVDEGQSLALGVSLNSYSWLPGEFSYQPYGISQLYPSSGPISENTNILVSGKGFDNEMKETARCKFGTDDNYVIVEGQVLDNEHMICKSPAEQIDLPEYADDVISLPFSIAFQEDIYYPYTEGPQKFRLYKHPVLTEISPEGANIGKLTEVYVTADENDGFWQPIPTTQGLDDDQYGIKCKFGRFGQTSGTYINETCILCLTPNIDDDPADISEEEVQVTVAMNGVDFNDDYSEVSFVFAGTGGSISTWVIIMGCLIFGLLIVSLLIFLSGIQEYMRAKNQMVGPRQSAYTSLDQRGALGPNIQPRSRGSRGGSRAMSNQLNNRLDNRGSDFPQSQQRGYNY